ncbi:MAG: D-aminoacyl-tRNA deacylase [Nanoarchaeota archaeon]
MKNKYLIVASKQDSAGINITTQLSQFYDINGKSFKFYLIEDDILHTENLNLEKINNFDFIIFASMHKSEKRQKTLSIHAPGNWRKADYGGEKNKASLTSSLFNKFLFEKLQNNSKNSSIQDYNITLEATHHGPLIDKPSVFIEIGSTEIQWKDSKAGFVIAKSIKDAIDKFENSGEIQYRETALGIGGTHYCPNFTKIQKSSNYALGHIIPLYSLPLSEEMISEALTKTLEEVDIILLDWKGLGNSIQRQQVLDVLDKLKLQYKRTSEVEK